MPGPFPLVVRGGLASAARVEWETIWQPQGWTHRIDARGGFVFASFDLLGPTAYLFNWFENGLGRYVQRYDETGTIIWEGLVWSLTLSLPGIQYAQTLENLSNKTFAQWSPTDFSGDVPVSGETVLTPAKEDADSQALYGIFESIVNSGAATLTNAEAARDSHHALYRRPAREPRDLPGGELRLSVECKGISEMFKHRTYTSASTGQANASTVVSAINTGTGQFVAKTLVSANTFQVGQYYDKSDREFALDALNEIADLGDGTDRWNWGVWEGRELRYQEVVQQVDYIRTLSDPYRRIQTLADRLTVPPWRLRPGKFVRQSDAFPFNQERSATLALDPTIQYSQAVTGNENDPYNYSIEYGEADSLINVLAGAW